jgi:mono/diheme cytochrome c family protein
MSEPREIAGAVALYNTPDDLVVGVAAARDLGFTHIDVVSPYPLHGIDTVLDKKPSRLGYVALAAGVIGVTIAKSAQWWMSGVDYPLNVGGKPLFSWPAFIPVTFEIMVLCASIATVIGMIAFVNKLPQYGNSLLGSTFMRDLTSDKFGLVVDAADPKFQDTTVTLALSGPNVLGVELLYKTPTDRFFREQVMSVPFLLLLVAVAFASATATRVVWRYGGAVPPFTLMKHQQKLVPQNPSSLFADGLGMGQPVEGTVARELMPYRFANDPAGAETSLVNPMPLTQATLLRGEVRFNVFCQPCHGPRGEGNGSLTAKFPKAPSLQSKKVREWSDGRIYHVLTAGQNVMPSYAAQISRDDRWMIIHHLRAVQRSLNAPERDVP